MIESSFLVGLLNYQVVTETRMEKMLERCLGCFFRKLNVFDYAVIFRVNNTLKG